MASGLPESPIGSGAEFAYEFTVPDRERTSSTPPVGVQTDHGPHAPLIVEDPTRQTPTTRPGTRRPCLKGLERRKRQIGQQNVGK